jgi:four helix bundle protein
MQNYNDVFRERTRSFAINLCKVFDELSYKEATWIVKKQILRSGTSVAANFRSACRARSNAEYYSKIYIVVEDCDETLFWLELTEDIVPNKKELFLPLHEEAIELLNVFSVTK